MATASDSSSAAQPVPRRVSPRICIGLDMQSGAPVAVRAEKSGRHTRTTVLPADSLAETAIRTRALLATCISPQEAFTRQLRTPLQSMAKARRVLPSALDILLPFELEQCVYEFPHVEKGADGKVQALAVVARRKELDDHVDFWRRQGLDPHVVDHEGLALWTQSLREIPVDQQSGQPARRVVVNAGRERWTLALGENRRFLGSHAAPANDAEAVRRILHSVWGASGAEGEPVLWLWAGPGGGQQSATVRDSLLQAWPGQAAVHDSPQTFLARALATRAAGRGPLLCNLRTGPLAHPALHKRQMRRRTLPAWTLLLASGILLGASLFASRMAARQEMRVDQAFARQRDRLIGYHRPVRGERAVEEAREAVAAQKERLQPFLQALQPSQSVLLLRISQHCADHDIALEKVDLDDNRLELRGSLAAPDDGAGLADLIERQGYESDIETTALDEEDRTLFAITGTRHNE